MTDSAPAVERYFSWLSRVVFGLALLAFAGGFAMGGLANPPRNPPPFGLRVVLLLAGAVFLYAAARSFFLSVVVTGSHVTVRNVFRTVRLARHDVTAIVIEDEIAAAMRPYLRTTTRGDVRLTPLSRTKNRMWGDEKKLRERIRRLASTLGLELIENPEAASKQRFG